MTTSTYLYTSVSTSVDYNDTNSTLTTTVSLSTSTISHYQKTNSSLNVSSAANTSLRNSSESVSSKKNLSSGAGRVAVYSGGTPDRNDDTNDTILRFTLIGLVALLVSGTAVGMVIRNHQSQSSDLDVKDKAHMGSGVDSATALPASEPSALDIESGLDPAIAPLASKALHSDIPKLDLAIALPSAESVVLDDIQDKVSSSTKDTDVVEGADASSSSSTVLDVATANGQWTGEAAECSYVASDSPVLETYGTVLEALTALRAAADVSNHKSSPRKSCSPIKFAIPSLDLQGSSSKDWDWSAFPFARNLFPICCGKQTVADVAIISSQPSISRAPSLMSSRSHA